MMIVERERVEITKHNTTNYQIKKTQQKKKQNERNKYTTHVCLAETRTLRAVDDRLIGEPSSFFIASLKKKGTQWNDASLVAFESSRILSTVRSTLLPSNKASNVRRIPN